MREAEAVLIEAARRPGVRVAVSRSTLLHLFLVLAASLLPVVLLAPFAGAPLMNDEGMFVTIAREMLRGALPYRDLFDIAPPVIYLWYAAGLLVLGERAWLADVLVMMALSLTTLLVYLEGRLLFSPRAGLVAAFAFASLAVLIPTGEWAQPGYLVLPPLVASLVAFTLGIRTEDVRWYLVVGLLGGVAVMTMQLVLAHFLVLLFFAWQRSRRTRGLPFWRVQPPVLALVGGLLIVPLVVALPYLLTGSLGDLLYGAVKFPLLYSGGSSLRERLLGAGGAAATYTLVAGPWLLLASIGAVLLARRGHSWAPLLLSWSAAAVLAIAITGKYNSHYFALLRPGMALLVGCALGVYWSRQGWRRLGLRAKTSLYGLFVVAFAFSALLNGRAYTLPTESHRHLTREVLASPANTRLRELQAPSVAVQLQRWTAPGQTIYNLGRQGELYVYADRRPASRFFHYFPLESDTSTIPSLLDDLRRNRPAVIIDTLWPYYLEGTVDFYPWQLLPFLEEQYEHVGRIEFDPALVEVYKEVVGERYEERPLTYYGDVYRLKEG